MCLTPEEVLANKVGRRLEPQTKEILNAVANYDYVSVFSGRGCTKTTSLALLAIWWIWSRKDSRIIATSPKYDTLIATLWAEIGKWLSRSNLKDEIVLTGKRLYHIDPEMLAFGQPMTAKDKENISGFHATHVLFLVDEASNVQREIIDAIVGGMSDPESKIVMAGNPTMASGPFFDTHNKDRKFWYKLRFSSEDSARKSPVWFARMQRYPKGSDLYRVYVDGLPPLGNPRAIISVSDCQGARDRTVTVAPDDAYLEIGVDPAREGDDMATIAVRMNYKLLEVRSFAKTKGPELESHILAMVREYRHKTRIKSKIRIKIDDHGIGGPIGDYLALNTTDNIEVVPCLFNGPGDDRYADSASIMWGNMAELIDVVELCDDDELIEELSTREWVPGGGKLKVEPKSIYKKRVSKSPDRADACILCFYTGVRKVFDKPDEGGEDVVAEEFTIDWQYENLTNPSFSGVFPIDILHYAALVFNKDLTVNGIAAVYQHYIDKLWVYESFYFAHPDPDIISMQIRKRTHHGLFDDDRNVKVIGNDSIFSKSLDCQPMSEILMRSKLYVSPPERYDEYGAIALGIRMYSNGQIKIHRSLEGVRKAIDLWAVKKGRPGTDDNGYGKAFLLILSEVRRRRKMKEQSRKPTDYHPIRSTLQPKEKNMTEWCTR